MKRKQEKHCGICDRTLPLSAFGKDRQRVDGLCCHCRECKNTYSRGWCKEHPAQVKARTAKHYKEHGDEIRAAAREYGRKHIKEARERLRKWRAAHPERSRDYHRQYNIMNRDSIRASGRLWDKNHPEARRMRARRRRAKQHAVRESFTARSGDIVRQSFRNRCAICGKIQPERGAAFPIDHWMPLSKGHALSLANAVLMCLPCNATKGSREPLDVYPKRVIRRIERLLVAQNQLAS